MVSSRSSSNTDLFDSEKIVAVVIGNEVDGKTQVAISARAPDTMKVGLGTLWEIEIDHDVY